MKTIDQEKKYFAINVDIDTVVVEPLRADSRKARDSFTQYVPRILALLDRVHTKATFFIIAKFAQDKVIANVIRQISDNGHEIANHSFSHNKHMSGLDYKDVFRDIDLADKILSDVIGKKIHGFRAPGYCLSDFIIRALQELDYMYDASLNTSKLYYLLKWAWKKTQRKSAQWLHNQPFSHCFLPNDPFYIDNKHLLENYMMQ